MSNSQIDSISARLTTDDHLVIGALVYSFRKKAGMTLADLGEIVGVSGEQIRKIECGINRVDFVRMVKIADALGVGIAHFAAKVK